MFKLGENARDLSAGVHRHEVLLGLGLCHDHGVHRGLHHELLGLLGPSRSSSWVPRRSADSPEISLILIRWFGLWSGVILTSGKVSGRM